MDEGSVVTVLVIIILILSGVLVYVAWSPGSKEVVSTISTPQAIVAPVPTAAPAISNPKDLNSASSQLDLPDLNQIDSELNKINTDITF